jgi:hypothetical protein
VSDDVIIKELRRMESGFKQDLNGVVVLQKEAADRSLHEHETTRKHVARLTVMVTSMWRRVYGSEPPPPGVSGLSFAMSETGTAPSSRTTPEDQARPATTTTTEADAKTGEPSIVQKVSDHDLTLAGLTGQVIAVDSKANELREKVDTLLSLQREQMGKHDADGRTALQRVADGFVWLAQERDGRKFALTLIAAIAGLIAACRGTTPTIVYGSPSPRTADVRPSPLASPAAVVSTSSPARPTPSSATSTDNSNTTTKEIR